jgi:hypothetical protein
MKEKFIKAVQDKFKDSDPSITKFLNDIENTPFIKGDVYLKIRFCNILSENKKIIQALFEQHENDDKLQKQIVLRTSRSLQASQPSSLQASQLSSLQASQLSSLQASQPSSLQASRLSSLQASQPSLLNDLNQVLTTTFFDKNELIKLAVAFRQENFNAYLQFISQHKNIFSQIAKDLENPLYNLACVIDDYEMNKNTAFATEKKFKIDTVEKLRFMKDKLKELKIKRNEIEDELVNKDCISTKSLQVLCLIYKISIIYISGKKYSEFLFAVKDDFNKGTKRNSNFMFSFQPVLNLLTEAIAFIDSTN